MIVVRSGVYFGLQSFVPVWFVHHFGTSEAAGNAALAVMLSRARRDARRRRLVDRIGRRKVLLGTIGALSPAARVRARAGRAAAGVLLAGIGFVTVMSFSVTVVMGQEYLPSRLGIASGVTLGWRSASAASPRRCWACWPTTRA